MRILFTGGGTGGHFFPIIAIAREVKRFAEENQIIDLRLYYMGGSDPEQSAILKYEGLVEIKILTGKIRRYLSGHNILDIFKIALGSLQALFHFFFIMPDAVFSKGGYGAFPAALASFVFRIPLVIHESDSIPGKVNQLSAIFAARVGIAFTQAAKFFPKEKSALVGVPLRKKLFSGSRENARQNLKLISNLPVVSFMGASQGARQLNDAVLGVLRELTNEFEVLHQSGASNLEEVKSEAEVMLEAGHKERYKLFGFLNEDKLRDFYNASDLVVSRAGASSIFEIAASGKPSILVPLDGAAQDHQRINAYEYVKTGACLIVEPTNLTPHVLLGDIRKTMSNQTLLQKMSEAASKFARLDSAEVVAREILKLAEH